MGLDVKIRFPAGTVPAWEGITKQLGRVGEAATIRMIDGLPAFPDESPEGEWKELRLGLAAGMVTLRRTSDSISCVVWGSADSALLAARDRVAWACAEAGAGTVATPAGEVPASEFARSTGISPA